MARLAAIVPDAGLCSLVSEAAKELNEDLLVLVAGGEEVLHAVRRAEAAGAEALVAKGYLADAARGVTLLPVVGLNPGPLDVVTAVARAKELGDKVALLHFGGAIPDLVTLGGSMGIELREFTVGRTAQEVRRILEQAKQDGCQVVVGGQVTVDMARSLGLKGVPISVGKTSARQAIEACRELVKVRRESDERRADYLGVLDSIPVGVIAVDPRGTVRLCNNAAVALGALGRADVGRPAAEAFDGSPLLAALKGEYGGAIKATRLGDARVGLEAVAWKSGDRNEGVVCVIHDVSAAERLVDQLSSPEGPEPRAVSFTFEDIPAASPAMQRVVAKAAQYAMSDLPLLISGERGVGKEVLAQAIHLTGIRRSGPFAVVSCEGLAPDAMERRLFGYERSGTSPSSRKPCPGVFETCHGGTVFLEEVWAMPMELQARVASVIEHGVFWRIGGTEPRRVDARIMASSSKRLKDLVARGEFSEALYWKISDLQIEVPPLRDRPDDIEPLFELFAGKLLGGTGRLRLSAASASRLRRYSWPGNVRELEGMVKRLAVEIRAMPLVPEDAVERMVLEELLPGREGPPETLANVTIPAGRLEDMVNEIIRQFDRACSGNRSEVARRLGISRTTLWKKMKEM
ncbi:MAG: sigma 54-interacting transcriptional regulator [Firmicutes bacterium]|jgi:propionate catabolism operon transcriptional regulator|nr:sigma 54-interacting transcriptional regulator [Bacillota bacterium]